MRIDVLTLFPGMITPVLNQSILWRARDLNIIDVHVHDFREHSENKHKKVDDYPYGGGAGMVLTPQPVLTALRSIPGYEKATKIIVTPQGEPYKQERAQGLSKHEHLIILCGHYEGFDDRIRDYFDLEISLGDYVLTGGEYAALVIIDSVTRLLPNALNKEASHEDDSFSDGLLEYPHYTRPPMFEDKVVPEVLLSGNHAKINAWRKAESLKRTKIRRPDLYALYLKKNDEK